MRGSAISASSGANTGKRACLSSARGKGSVLADPGWAGEKARGVLIVGFIPSRKSRALRVEQARFGGAGASGKEPVSAGEGRAGAMSTLIDQDEFRRTAELVLQASNGGLTMVYLTDVMGG